jgi:hypothetical protein
MTAPAQLHHEIEALSKRFAWFSQFGYRGSSPLYEQLSVQVAEDDELLRLAASAPVGQPVANLFFAAARYLALDPDIGDPVGLTTGLKSDGINPYPAFRDFCIEHEAAIRDLVATHGVQTNEVRRCACLLPALQLVVQMQRGLRIDQPLAIVEIGTSAGLNLLLDRYHYAYSDGRQLGDVKSPVQIECELRGDGAPPIPSTMPLIGHRVGLDLNPVDIYNDEDVRWLQALIWPEHTERQEYLRNAIEVARDDPARRIAGDAVE